MKSSQPSRSELVRLNKFIAQSGVASRRKADQLIESGQVTVNGRVIMELGIRINPVIDKVTVEGLTINTPNAKSYIAFYKPRGVLSSMSGPGETLQGYVQEMGAMALFHVGRLDQESEGLLLLTNDGDWANRIVHPRYEVSKEYVMDLDRVLTPEDQEKLLKGIQLEDGLFRADSATLMEGARVRVSIHDGRNRILRRAFDGLGYQVLGLKRVRVGGVLLGRMRPGEWKTIDPESIKL
jgi:23S rRNA pseudouridine2605 synthase